MRLLCTRNTHSQGFPLKISSIDESIKGREKKSCPPRFSLMPRCQLAVRNRQELGAMLINISAPDTFNQQLQLGQCICKKRVSEYLYLVFGRQQWLWRWRSTSLLSKQSMLIGEAHRGQCSSNTSVCPYRSAQCATSVILSVFCEASDISTVIWAFCSFVQPNMVCETSNKSVQAALIPPGWGVSVVNYVAECATTWKLEANIACKKPFSTGLIVLCR